MGSRSDDTLKDIEKLRESLDEKLGELEKRIPLAGLGRKGVAMLAGSGLAGTVATFAWRRLRSGSRKQRKGAAVPAAQAPVVVNVVPKGATFVAALGVAVWAGVKIYEVYGRMNAAGAERSRPAVVKPIEADRRSGAGS
jgi:hypothetical protein